jgi:hypothetical protein
MVTLSSSIFTVKRFLSGMRNVHYGGLFQPEQSSSGDFAILFGASAAHANRADNPAVDDNWRATFNGNHTRQA